MLPTVVTFYFYAFVGRVDRENGWWRRSRPRGGTAETAPNRAHGVKIKMEEPHSRRSVVVVVVRKLEIRPSHNLALTHAQFRNHFRTLPFLIPLAYWAVENHTRNFLPDFFRLFTVQISRIENAPSGVQLTSLGLARAAHSKPIPPDYFRPKVLWLLRNTLVSSPNGRGKEEKREPLRRPDHSFVSLKRSQTS